MRNMNKKGFLQGIGIIILLGIAVALFSTYSDGNMNLDLPGTEDIINFAKNKITGLTINEKDPSEYFKTTNIASGTSNSKSSGNNGILKFRKEYVANYQIYYGAEDPQILDKLKRYGMIIIRPENFKIIPYNAICVVNNDYASWRLAGCQGFYVDDVNSELRKLKEIDISTVIIEQYQSSTNVDILADFVLYEDLTTKGMNQIRTSSEIEQNKKAIKTLRSKGKKVLTLDYTTKELIASNAFANSRSVGGIPLVSKSADFLELK